MFNHEYMSVTFQYVSLGLQILLFVGSLYLIFFKSYFKEKGKYLATKEEIEGITAKVEAIKTEFIKETEKLKHELQFENHLKISFNTELKNTVIQTYENFQAWLEINYDTYSESIDCPMKKFKKFESEMDAAGAKYGAALAKLELYTDDSDMVNVIHELNLKCVSFQNNIDKFLMEMERVRENEIELSQEIEQMTNNGFKVPKALEKSWEDADKEIHKIYNEKGKEIKDEYEKILDINIIFRELCRNIVASRINN